MLNFLKKGQEADSSPLPTSSNAGQGGKEYRTQDELDRESAVSESDESDSDTVHATGLRSGLRPVPERSNEEDFRSFVERGPNQPRERFPKTKSAGCYRSFHKKWYELYPWLEYCNEADGVFCHTCRAFGTSVTFSKGSAEPAFTEHGCRNWQKLKKKLADHHKSDYHKQANEKLLQYLKQKPIDVILSVARAEEVKRKEAERVQNREVMTRLVRIVQILGIAGAPLRGHNEGENEVYRGLYKELYNMLADFDAVLDKHRKEAGNNVLYNSKTIQNDLILSIHDTMTDQMRTDFQNIRHLAVMMDETTDCSNHEQAVVLVRWCDENSKVDETLIAVKRAMSTKSQNLLDIILNALKCMGLSKKLIAQCYDGAANMQGHLNGLQAKLTEACGRDILTVHCYAHCLNLVLVDSMKNVREAFSFFGTVEALYVFIEGSAQRHGVFEEIAKSVNSKLKKLKKISETRWACRAEAVNAVAENVHIIIKNLEKLSTKEYSTAKVAAQAKGLLFTIQSFDFILWIRLLSPVLNAILVVSALFQKVDFDMSSALRAVTVLEVTIESFRDQFNNIYEECQHECEQNGIKLPNKRRRCINVRLEEHPETECFLASNEESRKAYLEVLDFIITGLKERFSQTSRSTLLAFDDVIKDPKPSEEKIREIAVFCDVEYPTLSGEIKLMRSDPEFAKAIKIPLLVNCFNSAPTAQLYPVVKAVLTTFLTIPVSIASAERTFSKLVLVKTKIRSTMHQDRLEPLLHMFIEQKRCKNVNIDNCINKFKSYGPRKLLL